MRHLFGLVRMFKPFRARRVNTLLPFHWGRAMGLDGAVTRGFKVKNAHLVKSTAPGHFIYMRNRFKPWLRSIPYLISRICLHYINASVIIMKNYCYISKFFICVELNDDYSQTISKFRVLYSLVQSFIIKKIIVVLSRIYPIRGLKYTAQRTPFGYWLVSHLKLAADIYNPV